ncbi:hypothetical protein EW145_g5066 [Phellinidium pouzarii]|uniref:Protein kinase domain-containing protein n=1 Tax=Phellinidium pouzarii TaxID=167371 RepID=A0A4S4L1J4_9AGAM|nr:hypothetical protein EW145_g5066 [Phellinidium pouzarii]
MLRPTRFAIRRSLFYTLARRCISSVPLNRHDPLRFASTPASQRLMSDLSVLTFRAMEGDPNEVLDFEFVEEPLGFPVEHGFGYIELEFGQVLDDRYEIRRKLGWGLNSSVWLSWDLEESRYVAIKVLTMSATDNVWAGRFEEVKILEHLSSPTPLSATIAHCMPLLRYSFLPDKERKGYGRFKSTADIDALLDKDPSRRHSPERSLPPGRWVQAAVSQPLPMPSLEDAMTGSFILTDFGSDAQVTNDITPVMLRAPETLLEGPWNEKVDIWIVGCLIYEFLAGAHLFFQTSVGDDKHMPHLQQMAAASGDFFKQSQLSESKRGSGILKPGAEMLNGVLPRRLTPVSNMLGLYCKEMQPRELQGAVSMIERCLRLDPKDRPSAHELLGDPWLTSTGQA